MTMTAETQDKATTTPQKTAATTPQTSPDLSPNAMVQEAFQSAMRDQEKEKLQQQKKSDEDDEASTNDIVIDTSNKRPRSGDRCLQEMEAIRDENASEGQVVLATRDLVFKYVDELIQDGTFAYQEWEQTQQKLKISQDDCAAKTRELERLRASEQKSRESIANLLKAVGTANDETKDQSQAKLVEARMRADLLHMTSQRDEALGNLAECQRRCKLVEDELSQTKIKLCKVQQEKVQVERDQRATLSLAKSLQGNVHSDIDYYKRKVNELNTHVQGLSAVLTEKNRQIEDLRRQMERSMSQNRLAAFRADSAGHRKRSSY